MAKRKKAERPFRVALRQIRWATENIAKDCAEHGYNERLYRMRRLLLQTLNAFLLGGPNCPYHTAIAAEEYDHAVNHNL